MPSITIRRNRLGTIIVIRNPFNGAWIMNLTIASRKSSELSPKLAYASYIFSILALVLLFVGCNPSESQEEGTNVFNPSGVCIESYPVVPDTIVSNLTNGYPYKVSQVENNRNRCFVNPYQDGVICHSKERGDTLYFIDTYCPATLKARAELGGN